MLLPEVLLFAQRVSAAGGAAQVEVWEGMWHDFVEHSEGCASGLPLRQRPGAADSGSFSEGNLGL